MEVKKSPKADLEGKKTIFLEIGFVIALGILLSAFNWKTNTKVEEGFVITQEEQVEEEIIPITQQMMKSTSTTSTSSEINGLDRDRGRRIKH